MLATLLPYPHVEAYFTILLFFGMLVMFVREDFPPETVALGAAAILFVTGVLKADMLKDVFANAAPWTVVGMFIISGGLVRTGALNALVGYVTRNASLHPGRVLLLMGGFTVTASAFINNTPVVVMLLPVTIALARSLGMSPSKLLIPLSYLTVLGGLCTMIGTSTNLVVDGVAREAGLAPFGLFEVSAVGLILAVTGFVYLWFAAPLLLPDRDSMATLLSDRKTMRFFTEVAVPEGSPIIGQRVGDVSLFQRQDIRVIDVLRGDESLRRQFPEVTLAQGDRVVLRTDVAELLGLKESGSVHMVDALGSRSTATVEALITPGCTLVGRSLGELRLRRRYGVYPLAVHRRAENIGRQLDEVVIRIGDTLLLEGAHDDMRRLADDVGLVNISEPAARAYRRNKWPVAIATLAAVIVLASLDVAPILALSFLGVAILLVTRTLDADEAFGLVDGRLLALLLAMLAVGEALEGSGAVTLIVDGVAPHLVGLPAWGVVLAVYFVTLVLTELISNNAVAVVMTPVVISLAQNIGVDPRPLVVTVMIAASAAFATPIGYQTNTMVYGPGGYRFTDFTRIGLPLNIILALVSCLIIPVFFPL